MSGTNGLQERLQIIEAEPTLARAQAMLAQEAETARAAVQRAAEAATPEQLDEAHVVLSLVASMVDVVRTKRAA